MKTEGLKGIELYYWVVEADKEANGERHNSCANTVADDICTYYRLIVEREQIDIASAGDHYCAALYQFSEGRQWSCHVGRSRNALTAAMRAFVHSQFGSEVIDLETIPLRKLKHNFAHIHET